MPKRSKLTEMKELVVYLKGEKIKNIENEKLVGVIVNQNVSWEHHINKTIKQSIVFWVSPVEDKETPATGYKKTLFLYLHTATFRLLVSYMGCLPPSTFRNWFSFRNDQQELFLISQIKDTHLKKCSQNSNGWHSKRELITENVHLFRNHKTVWAHNISQICSHLCLRFMAGTQDQLLIVIYMYHRVGTRKCTGKVWDILVPKHGTTLTPE